MVYTYSEAALQVAIAQLAQNVGWNGIGSSSFEVLVDVCARFIREIGKCSSSIANQYNRTQVNFDDVQVAFNLLGISLGELDDYYAHVDQMPFALGKVPKFPVQTRPPIRTNPPDTSELKMRSEIYDEWLPSLRLNSDGGDSLLENSKNGSESDAMDVDRLLQQSLGGRVDEELLDKRYISSLKTQLGNDSKIGGYTELSALLPKYIYLSNQGQVLSYGTKEGGMLPEARPPPLMPEDLKRAEEEEKRKEEQIQKEKERDQAACQPLKLKLNSKDKKKMLDKYRKDPKQMKGDVRSKELLKKAKKDKALKSKMNIGKLSMKVVGLNKGLPMAIASPLGKDENDGESFFKLDQEDDDPDNDRLNASADLNSEEKLSELDKSNESILNTSLNSLDNALNTTPPSGPRPVGRPKGSTNKKPKIMTTEVLEKLEKKREREKKREEELLRKLALREERRRKREELERQKEEKRKERERKRVLKMQQKTEKTPEKRRGRPPKNRTLLSSNANKDESKLNITDMTSMSNDVLDMNTSNTNDYDDEEAANILVSLSEDKKSVRKNQLKKTSRAREDSLHDDRDDDDDDDDASMFSDFSDHMSDFKQNDSDSEDLEACKKSVKSNESESNALVQSTPRFKSLAELKAMPDVVNKTIPPSQPKKRGRKPKPKPPPPEEVETLDATGKRGKGLKSREFVDDGFDSDLSEDEKAATKSARKEPVSVPPVEIPKLICQEVDKPKAKVLVKEEEKKKRRKKPEINAQELYEQALFPKLTVKFGDGETQSVSPIPILRSVPASPPLSPRTKFKREIEKEKLKKEKLAKKEEKKESKKEEKREVKKVEEEPLREDETKKFKKKAKVIITPTRAARKEAMENCTVITQTVSTAESGNKIWICPSCSQPDDGSPMIGCDNCDDWFHWRCVGIVSDPDPDESWFCKGCISKQQQIESKFKKKKRHDSESERPKAKSVEKHFKPESKPKEEHRKWKKEEDKSHHQSEEVGTKLDSRSKSTSTSVLESSSGQEYICPTCDKPDDGSPMIGCDNCDDWFHWVCVEIQIAPKDDESWYCKRCKNNGGVSKKKKHKKH